MKNTQVTLSEAQGPLNQLNVNLSGENGRMWLDEFNKFLRKQQSWIIPSRWEKNIWTKANIGTKKPLKILVDKILKRGFEISYSEHVPLDLLELEEQIKFNDRKEEVYFAAVSPRELGLYPGNWTQRELLAAAPKYELEPCLSGDILEILADPKFDLEKINESLDIAMVPIKIGNPVMFAVGKYENYHLGYLNGNLNQVYTYPGNVDNKYLFRTKKRYNFD